MNLVESSILMFSALLLYASYIRNVKLALLGSDYSPRLYATIEVNMFAALGLGIYLGIRRKWIAMIAALALAFAWLLVGAVNSAV